MPKVTKIKSLQYLGNISKKRRVIHFICCMKIHIKVFYKLIPFLQGAIARHPQSTKNNKFAISFQYLKKEGRGEVGFLHANNIKLSNKLALSIVVGVAHHIQSNQDDKFVKYLQYLKMGRSVDEAVSWE